MMKLLPAVFFFWGMMFKKRKKRISKLKYVPCGTGLTSIKYYPNKLSMRSLKAIKKKYSNADKTGDGCN